MSYSDEKQIACMYTTLGVDDNSLCQQPHLMADDLLPVFDSLRHKCEGIITTSGIYVFQLEITSSPWQKS